MNVKVTKITTYNPGEALFDSWRRNIRGDWGAVAGVLTSNLRLNIGDAAMALFCRANEGTLLGLLIMILIVRVCVWVFAFVTDYMMRHVCVYVSEYIYAKGRERKRIYIRGSIYHFESISHMDDDDEKYHQWSRSKT